MKAKNPFTLYRSLRSGTGSFPKEARETILCLPKFLFGEGYNNMLPLGKLREEACPGLDPGVKGF